MNDCDTKDADDLEKSYHAMATDHAREQEALIWSEAFIGDCIPLTAILNLDRSR